LPFPLYSIYELRSETSDARSEVFTAVKIQVQIFWFVMSCSFVVG